VYGEADAAITFQARLRVCAFDRFIHPDLYASMEI
jgi:hypothetical protein